MLRWLTEPRHSEVCLLGWFVAASAVSEIKPWYFGVLIAVVILLLFDALDRWLYRRAWGHPRPDA